MRGEQRDILEEEGTARESGEVVGVVNVFFHLGYGDGYTCSTCYVVHFKYVHFFLYQSYPHEAIKILCVLPPNCYEFGAQLCADDAVLSLFFPEV